jgi:hypothetical protein
MDAPIPDPYRSCTVACTHELSRGVLIAELLEVDGPYPAASLLVNLTHPRNHLLGDEQFEFGGGRPLLTEAV